VNKAVPICAMVSSLMLLALASAGPALAAATDWDSHPHGAARLITASEATGSANRLDAALQLRLTPGWHTYWRTPGDAGIPPSVDWNGSENLAAATIAWPTPQRLPPLAGLETLGYVDGIVLPIAITLAHPGEPLHLHAEVDYASCKDICILYHASLDLRVPAGLAQPGPEAPLVAEAEALVPGDFEAADLNLLATEIAQDGDGSVLSVRVASGVAPMLAPDLFLEGATTGSPGQPRVTLAEAGHSATFKLPLPKVSASEIAKKTLHVTLVDGLRAAEADAKPVIAPLAPMPTQEPMPTQVGRLAIVGLALLGGLILNLMPCVLPVLSLKLLALVGYAGSERRAARLGLLATAAGVLASFGVLAAALIGLKLAGAAVGWGIQFQQPWFLAGMALLTTVFAASLWDWLPIMLPGQLASAVGGVRAQGRFLDAFLLGAFATLLAASCSAPFLGTAIGFALARGPGDILLVFGALGLGMAAPFLVIAAAPRLVAWLPRPGPWMDWLRGVLGFALLGTAAWLIFILALEAGTSVAFVAGGTLTVFLGTLAWRHHLPAPGRRQAATIAAMALAIIAVLIPSLHGRAEPLTTPELSANAGLWRSFDEQELRGLIGQGRVVFVDVTAAWCLTCKVNELTVLDRAPVADLLRSPGVIAMRADWTHPDPAITAYLQSFGRYGVPLDVVYGPDAPGGIALPELLTPQAVSDAFRRAGSGTTKNASR